MLGSDTSMLGPHPNMLRLSYYMWSIPYDIWSMDQNPIMLGYYKPYKVGYKHQHVGSTLHYLVPIPIIHTVDPHSIMLGQDVIVLGSHPPILLYLSKHHLVGARFHLCWVTPSYADVFKHNEVMFCSIVLYLNYIMCMNSIMLDTRQMLVQNPIYLLRSPLYLVETPNC
jgi:hypothetical protein